MLHLSENIKTIRLLMNKTQSEFAEIFNVKDKKDKFSKDKIQSYEGRRAEPPEWLIKTIASAVNVSIEVLKNKKLEPSIIKIDQDYIQGLYAVKKNQLSDNNSSRYNSPISPELYIKTLESKILLLEEQNGFLKEQLLATLKRLETNYESSLKNQQELLAKVQAHIYASAKRFAGDDKRKLQLEMENMYNKAGEFLNYTHDSGKKDGS
jgi:transcriptional regulator with XRE-family HTH domain